MLIALCLTLSQVAFADPSLSLLNRDYIQEYKEYQSLRADQIREGLHAEPVVNRLRGIITSADVENIKALNKKMKHQLKLHANRNITYSQLAARPRIVGTQVIKTMAPLSVLGLLSGHSGASAAEGTGLSEHSSGVMLSEDTAFKALPESSIEKWGSEVFVSGGQK